MAIELSNLTFTDENDIVPASGVEQILNTGIANTLAGNDRITGTGGDYGFKNVGTLNTDDGNDTITGIGSRPSDPNFGFSYGLINSGTFNTGEGNDRITGTTQYYDGIVNSGTFNTGEGNDTIYGAGFYDGLTNSGTFNTGEGNDVIIGDGRGSGIYSGPGSIFDTGDGNDLISVYSRGGIDNYSNAFTTGDGNDTIESGDGDYPSINNRGLINTGNGEDYIIYRGALINYGGVFLGEGNDLIIPDPNLNPDYNYPGISNYNAIKTGDGDDIITSTGGIYNEGVIETGNGDDSIIANSIGSRHNIYNNGGRIDTGDGNDSIIVNGGFQSGLNNSGSVFLGNGEDYIKGFGSGDFYGGNGNDTLELTPGTYTVGIWGEGGESPIFTKGNQLMITSEFEKLRAGNTIYDFTSLTAGQIITVA
jgi:hypothetical protein